MPRRPTVKELKEILESKVRRPTIAELEEILESNEQPCIEILPDGSVHAVPGQPDNAKPRIVTLGEALGNDY